MKKLLSAVLAVVMILAAVSLWAFAGNEEEPVGQFVFDKNMTVSWWDHHATCRTTYDEAEDAFKITPANGNACMTNGHNSGTIDYFDDIGFSSFPIGGENGYNFVKIMIKLPKDYDISGASFKAARLTVSAKKNAGVYSWDVADNPTFDFGGVKADGEWHEYIADLTVKHGKGASFEGQPSAFATKTVQVSRLMFALGANVTEPVYIKYLSFFQTLEEAEAYDPFAVPETTVPATEAVTEPEPITNGVVKLDGSANYQAYYVWSHMHNASDAFKLTFYVKGTAGTRFNVDNEAGTSYGSFEIAKTDAWQKIEIETVLGKDDARNTGAPIRIYTNWEHDEFVIDDFSLTIPGDSASTDFTDNISFPFGAWGAGSGVAHAVIDNNVFVEEPVETEPVETEPEETEPEETEPEETEPEETEPEETEPEETEPEETESEETEPEETEPEETEPEETEPEETEPEETEPEETEPEETEPEETEPEETEPEETEPEETEPEETEPEETEPEETEPEETEPEETEPEETEPEETEPEETEPEETEPEETEPEETEPEETEPEETEPEETEPEETEPEETEPEETEPKETEPKETEPEETEPAETGAKETGNEDAPKTGDMASALIALALAAGLCVVAGTRKFH